MEVATNRPKAPLLVRALRGEKVERTPVWAMRQAGRWDPEFRKLRGSLTFYEFSENAELSAAASLCPLRFGVDAIILFYDITTLAVSMGQKFDLVPQRGPVPTEPIRTRADVEKLESNPDPSTYQHVLDILRIVKREVGPEIPVLVFAGAPFTMAAYQTGMGKSIDKLRDFIGTNESTWSALLEKTSCATVGFLRELMNQGAAAYQLFDSWAGGLTLSEYAQYAHPYHEEIFHAAGGLSILFVKDLPYVDLAAKSGANVISLGTAHDLATLKKTYPDLVFQGNVDHMLLVHGKPDDVREATLRCMKEGAGVHHVLNLDHGMDPNAHVENFETFIATAKEI